MRPNQNFQPLKEGISIEDKRRTLQDCLDSLCNEGSENPLPCREDKIAHVSDFISRAFQETTPKILYITGNPGTGKTATIKHCINLAPYPDQILYENCKSETPKLLNKKKSLPKIRVLDEIETLTNLQSILSNSLSLNVSVIGLSNSHDTKFAIEKFNSNAETLVYDEYEPRQIVTILRERTGESHKCSSNLRAISENALIMLANQVAKERGDVRLAIQHLRYILTQAIAQNAETLTLSLCSSLLGKLNSTTIKKNPVSELPLPTKLALFSISKDPSNWISHWRRASEKIRSDISSGPNEQLAILKDHEIIRPVKGKAPPKIVGLITNEMIYDALGDEILAVIN